MTGKLIVSERSWHYRLYSFGFQAFNWQNTRGGPWEAFLLVSRVTHLDTPSVVPKNLCRYFWSIVGLLLAGILVSVVVGILFVLIAPFVWLVFKFKDSEGHQRRLSVKKAKRLAKYGAKPKEPGLLRSFLSAKKSKVCPMIEVRP